MATNNKATMRFNFESSPLLQFGKCGRFLFKPTNPNPTHRMIHMDQMILSEPSIIIIWTYQDMMEWMS
jgi:hypothetical protein